MLFAVVVGCWLLVIGAAAAPVAVVAAAWGAATTTTSIRSRNWNCSLHQHHQQQRQHQHQHRRHDSAAADAAAVSTVNNIHVTCNAKHTWPTRRCADRIADVLPYVLAHCVSQYAIVPCAPYKRNIASERTTRCSLFEILY